VRVITRAGVRLSYLLHQLKGYRMDEWERRAQYISWAVGQVRCMRECEHADEWGLRQACANMWEVRELIAHDARPDASGETPSATGQVRD
jgi:hypothetical protein